MTRYILVVLFFLNSMSFLLAGLSVSSIYRKEGGDIVSFLHSCKANTTICKSSRATCRQIDGSCACPKRSTFYRSKCQKQVSNECRYFINNALSSNETYVPTIKLKGVTAFKQIGGFLKYATKEKEKIHVFRSCVVDASLYWNWSKGEWVLLDKKDFAVESVGNSICQALRWNGTAPNYAYQGHLVKVRLTCKSLEGKTYSNCLVFKVQGNAADPIMKANVTVAGLISVTKTKTKIKSSTSGKVVIDKQVFIIVCSAVALPVAFAVIKAHICCWKCTKRCDGSNNETSAVSTTENGEQIELNVIQSNSRTRSNNSQHTNANARIDVESLRSDQTYCSIRSRLRSMFRFRATTSSSNSSSYDYPEMRNGFPRKQNTTSSNTKNEVERTTSNDSEGYVKMAPSQLATIKEGDDYEPPVVAEDEKHSYLHLECSKDEKYVAKLVSQFNKSMDGLNLQEEGRQRSPPNLQARSMEAVYFPEKDRKNPFPKLQSKSMEVLSSAENGGEKSPKPKIPHPYKSLKFPADSRVEEYAPLNPNNFTPMYQPLNERTRTRPDSYFQLDKETLNPVRQPDVNVLAAKEDKLGNDDPKNRI